MGRDAFGRETDEDPLEAMGWSSSTAQTRPRTPVEVSRESTAYEWAEAVPADGSPRTVRPLRALSALLSVLLPVAVLGAIGLGIVGTIVDEDSGGRVAEDGTPPAPDVVPAEVETDAESDDAPAAPAQTGPPTGFRSDSLLLRKRFSRAMDALRARRYGALRNLRVAADRINAQLVTSDGRLRNVQVDPDLGVRLLSEAGPGFPRGETLPFSSIDPAAPYRAARSAAGRSKRSPSSVDYLVAIRALDESTWVVFLENGDHYQADARGRITRRIG